MQDFQIGQLIYFDHISESCYIDDEKTVIHSEIQPMKGLIVGKAYKQEGTYNKSRGGSSLSGYSGEEDYEPPSLSVSRVIILWEVKTGWRNRPLLVLDEYATPWSGEFTLPTQSLKPIKIITEKTSPIPQ